MKRVEWRSPNRIRIDTGHKAFDRQCEFLGAGNVWGNVQYSSYIRAHNATECNGFTFKPGELLKGDLDKFELPQWVRNSIEPLLVDKGAILYELRHWNRGKKFVHGYILTGTDHELMRTYYVNGRIQSERILNVCAEYVSNCRL